MSGHNKWSQIKNKKGAADLKRGKIFSKILRAISIAAKTEPNIQFNPRLRAAVDIAKENQVPLENIERAINKASEEKNLEDLVIEAYGPEGSALIILAITDNRNRTIAEIKSILSDNNSKMANQGSVLWSFNPPAEGKSWTPKFPQAISEESKQKLEKLLTELDEHEDIQDVITSVEGF
ncbi:MAG: YebC/PmpR family DNA-binding transcriptional regulator [Candidatus Pacebacteria bacterium]|nr:YebC/PmpR family DNA-binding transcriptional regulator [Candidatus Paceibacterota bacterium]